MPTTTAMRNRTRKLYEQQGGKCFYCNEEVYLAWEVTEKFREVNMPFIATFEHIKPRSKGGSYSITNGVCACTYCNNLRGNKPFEGFVEYINKVRHIKSEMVKLRDPETAIGKPMMKRISSKKYNAYKKKKKMFMMNSYLVARFAQQAAATVEELFEQYVHPDYWKVDATNEC